MRSFGPPAWLPCIVLLAATAIIPCTSAQMPGVDASRSNRLVTLRDFKQRLAVQPNGPFAAAIFPEDALGDYVGVIYWSPMTNPAAGKWRIQDRFWQDSEWSADVTSLAWAPSGRYLYVATGGVYGTGYVYRLDLMNRSAEAIFPAKPDLERASEGGDFESEIVGFDTSRKVLKLQFRSSGPSQPLIKEVPFE